MHKGQLVSSSSIKLYHLVHVYETHVTNPRRDLYRRAISLKRATRFLMLNLKLADLISAACTTVARK
jgi:hypothetical protein